METTIINHERRYYRILHFSNKQTNPMLWQNLRKCVKMLQQHGFIFIVLVVKEN